MRVHGKGSLALVDVHLREQIQYGNARDNQDKPYDGSQIGHLLEKEDAADGDEGDAESRPGGIRDADGNGPQAKTQQVERCDIADERSDGRDEFGELLRHLEEGGAGSFCDNGEDKKYVVEHGNNIQINFLKKNIFYFKKNILHNLWRKYSFLLFC